MDKTSMILELESLAQGDRVRAGNPSKSSFLNRKSSLQVRGDMRTLFGRRDTLHDLLSVRLERSALEGDLSSAQIALSGYCHIPSRAGLVLIVCIPETAARILNHLGRLQHLLNKRAVLGPGHAGTAAMDGPAVFTVWRIRHPQYFAAHLHYFPVGGNRELARLLVIFYYLPTGGHRLAECARICKCPEQNCSE